MTNNNLTAWDRVLICRHSARPQASDFIQNLCESFIELHGDRLFRDDSAIIGGIGYIGGERCMIVAQEKGKDTESRLKHNFGMPHPEGYRKALRLMRLAEKFEIIVVNDGSLDKTSQIAHSFAKKYPFVKVIDQKNQGYGGAVNTGFKASKYSLVFYTDSDLQFDIRELSKFVPYVKNYDLIIGYRKKRAEGLRRSIFASGMKIWNRIFLGFPIFIKDIDCAFKLIKKDVIRDVGELSCRGNLVSAEFLLKSYKLGYKFHQIGVTHYLRKAGVSTCGGLDDIVKVIKETFILISHLSKDSRFNAFETAKNRIAKRLVPAFKI